MATPTAEILSMPARASVVVLKIQEFRRRPVADQTRLKAQLEALVALAIQPLPAADRIVLETPDGAVLVVSAPNVTPAHAADRERDATPAERGQSYAADHGGPHCGQGAGEALTTTNDASGTHPQAVARQPSPGAQAVVVRLCRTLPGSPLPRPCSRPCSSPSQSPLSNHRSLITYHLSLLLVG
jgi:hypothetical protein